MPYLPGNKISDLIMLKKVLSSHCNNTAEYCFDMVKFIKKLDSSVIEKGKDICCFCTVFKRKRARKVLVFHHFIDGNLGPII